MLTLGSSLDVTKVMGIGLLYTKLAQRVPTIFENFMRNLPTRHYVLAFICVKYLPVNTISAEERFTFRRTGPKEHKIYRCGARYGYRDIRSGKVEFENQLLEYFERIYTVRLHIHK